MIFLVAFLLSVFMILGVRFALHKPMGLRGVIPEAELPMLCTHRGYGKKNEIPENTLEAFQKSVKAGFRAHELDVRVTRDAVPVLFHGPKLEDYTDGYGRMEILDYESARTLNYGYYVAHNHKIAHAELLSLSEYLNLFGKKCFTNIELKRERSTLLSPLEESVQTIVNAYRCEGRVFFSSFNLITLIRLKMLRVKSPIGLLLEPGRFNSFRLYLSAILVCPDNLHLHHTFQNHSLVNRFRKKGYGIVYWTVNEPEKILELFQKNADVIITDRIDLIKDKKFRKFK